MFSFQGASLSPSFKKLNETSINISVTCCFSQSLVWWRVPGSNRWPPACKAGALPAELTPHRGSILKWWAKMDSNHRPHDYQSCALASWAIGPYFVEIKSTTFVLKSQFQNSTVSLFLLSEPNPLRWALLRFLLVFHFIFRYILFCTL